MLNLPIQVSISKSEQIVLGAAIVMLDVVARTYLTVETPLTALSIDCSLSSIFSSARP